MKMHLSERVKSAHFPSAEAYEGEAAPKEEKRKGKVRKSLMLKR
jgi:hypothetical protein